MNIYLIVFKYIFKFTYSYLLNKSRELYLLLKLKKIGK